MLAKPESYLIGVAISLGIMLLFSSCALIFPDWQPMPTPVPFTPTPHYTPMAGRVYIADSPPLFKGPRTTGWIVDRIPADVSSLEILESTWYYYQGRYGDEFCYMYRVQVPGTDIEGWLPQDWVMQEREKEVPWEYGCFQGGEPTSTPSSPPEGFEVLVPGAVPTRMPTVHTLQTPTMPPRVGSSHPLSPTQIWTRPTDNMKMVQVSAGSFQMGSEKAFPCSTPDQRPQHIVKLDTFWIDQTEVTAEQYKRCVQVGDCDTPTACDFGEGVPTYEDPLKATHPMVCVNWHEAQAYCEWSGGRLPTEAEWEYAARGPESYLYSWGNDLQQACVGGNFWAESSPLTCGYSYTTTVPVGSFPAGASWCGALDMAGNAAEWVQDWYGDYPVISAIWPQANPSGPARGTAKVIRGGSWHASIEFVHTAARMAGTPGLQSTFVGFRCVVVR